ncbi:uncharacterized protein LOC105698622 [Orussus abietinus]|uniref:uncharacterized protein LOC105698622 n=1 Tax=Orussus abietinus TaxID=222816 RepID=UPI000626AC54|nr:uncharacterized protein LOC105698622 [Orussus abietinus]
MAVVIQSRGVVGCGGGGRRSAVPRGIRTQARGGKPAPRPVRRPWRKASINPAQRLKSGVVDSSTGLSTDMRRHAPEIRKRGATDAACTACTEVSSGFLAPRPVEETRRPKTSHGGNIRTKARHFLFHAERASKQSSFEVNCAHPSLAATVPPLIITTGTFYESHG